MNGFFKQLIYALSFCLISSKGKGSVCPHGWLSFEQNSIWWFVHCFFLLVISLCRLLLFCSLCLICLTKADVYKM